MASSKHLLTRRAFLARSGAAASFYACAGLAGRAAENPPPHARIRSLTRGPKHHFFGYYGMSPWSQSGRKLLCLESSFQDHMPRPEETARVCLVDAAGGPLQYLTETRAWNFQQGTMFRWNPLAPESEIFYNDIYGAAAVKAEGVAPGL